MREVIGTYGLAVICADQPDTIVGARRGSPLIIGIGNGENFLASDANAIVAHTRKGRLPERLRRGDHHAATASTCRISARTPPTCRSASWNSAQEDAERGEYAHFMLKEIFEQPRTVENALRGRMDFEGATAKFGGLNMTAAELRGD